MARYAFLVAVERFSDARISQVQHAENDARELAKVFESLGFDEVTTLVNHEATKTAVESKLRKAVGRLTKADTFYLFVASHGLSENGHNFVLCHDSQADDVVRTSLSLQGVYDLFKGSACKQCVMLLDACETGVQIDPSMRGLIAELSEHELRDFFDKAEYCAGFAACKTGESSYSSARLKHGVWTYCLIQALSGYATTAIERRRFVTSASLQNYLSLEVPRELRHDRGPGVTQTPWLFGGQSREFVIADVGDLLAARQIPPPLDMAQLKRVLFRADETGMIRRLSGFKKSHHVPEDVNGAAASFVGRIAETEIKSDLERMFEKIRDAFGYKRLDMEVHGPNDGTGSIDTPAFAYAVSVTQNPDAAREYVLRREVAEIKDPSVVVSEPFNELFDGMFDTLEFEFRKPLDLKAVIDALERKGVEVDYDSGSTCCRVSLPKFPVEIVVGANSLQLVHGSPQSPRELVAAFKTFGELAAKQDLKMLSVA